MSIMWPVLSNKEVSKDTIWHFIALILSHTSLDTSSQILTLANGKQIQQNERILMGKTS